MHFILGLVISVTVILHILSVHSIGSSNPILNSLSSINLLLQNLIFKDVSGVLSLYMIISSFIGGHEEYFGSIVNNHPVDMESTPKAIVPE